MLAGRISVLNWSFRTLLLVSAVTAAPWPMAIAAEQRTASPPTAANPPEKTTDPKPAAAKGASPLCDAGCVRRAMDAAAQACAPLIEAKAPVDYDWLARPFGGIFQQAEPSRDTSIVRYRGDAIRFLTPQNQWTRVSYECGYDVAVATIAFVNIRLGRLDRPATASAEQANDQTHSTNTQRPSPPASQVIGQQGVGQQVLAPQIIGQQAIGQQGTGQQGNMAAGQPPTATKSSVHYGEPSVIDISQLPARR